MRALTQKQIVETFDLEGYTRGFNDAEKLSQYLLDHPYPTTEAQRERDARRLRDLIVALRVMSRNLIRAAGIR